VISPVQRDSYKVHYDQICLVDPDNYDRRIGRYPINFF
jgi:hypothetical protein